MYSQNYHRVGSREMGFAFHELWHFMESGHALLGFCGPCLALLLAPVVPHRFCLRGSHSVLPCLLRAQNDAVKAIEPYF